jgi:hypothetical protein
MSDDKTDEGYDEFIKEYGLKYKWDNERNPNVGRSFLHNQNLLGDKDS